MNPIFIILRGQPGSSKTTFAETLSKLGSFVHLETDFYFYQDGIYKFDPNKLKENHVKCFGDFKIAVERGSNIILANTNIKKSWYSNYKAHAEAAGYMVFEVLMCGNYQNTHGVPGWKVEEMKLGLEF